MNVFIQNVSLFIYIVYNEGVKADRNGARLPVACQEVPVADKTAEWKRGLKETNLNKDGVIILFPWHVQSTLTS